jgi:FkbM family methyltransferase
MLFTDLDKYITTRKGAIHIGANEGQERLWYAQNGFENVLWFEPNTKVFEILRENISMYKHHRYYNLGVHDTLKTAMLNISSNRGESSSILELGLHKKYYGKVKYIGQQEIELVRMDYIFDELENINLYNFLNIDVQGVELNVIKSFGKYLSNIDYIYTEVNTGELYVGCCKLSEIDEYLKHHGFIRLMTKMTKSEWGDAFYKKY